MIQLAKVFTAWALTLFVYVAIATTFLGQRSSPAGELTEGLLGIGLVIGVPALVFALAIVWPVAALLRAVEQPWIFVLGAAALFGLVMLLVTAIIMPSDWKGASQALVAFAALLGLVWGIVSLLTTPTHRVG